MDSLKGASENIEEYHRLCEKYNEEVQMLPDRPGHVRMPDAWGEHAQKLKLRERSETKTG